MARTITSTALVARIRARGEVSSNYLDDATLLDWVNLAIAELQDILIDCDADRNCTSALVNVVANAATHAIPTGLYGLRRVDILKTDGKWAKLSRISFDELLDEQTATASRESCRYSLVGDYVYLSPPPAWSATGGLRIWYWPVLADLVMGGSPTSMDGVNGWDEFVVDAVLVWCAMAQEEEAAGFLALKQYQEQRIRRRARVRDLAEPKQMVAASRGRLRRHDRLPRPT